MNMIQLKQPPENAWTYVNPPESVVTEVALEQWIRDMVKQGALNLHIEECFLQTIANLETELVAAKYKVQILPIAGKTAAAEFYLERIPV